MPSPRYLHGATTTADWQLAASNNYASQYKKLVDFIVTVLLSRGPLHHRAVSISCMASQESASMRCLFRSTLLSSIHCCNSGICTKGCCLHGATPYTCALSQSLLLGLRSTYAVLSERSPCVTHVLGTAQVLCCTACPAHTTSRLHPSITVLKAEGMYNQSHGMHTGKWCNL